MINIKLTEFFSGKDMYFIGKDRSKRLLVLMNDEDREHAMKECHDNPDTGGHRGVTITQKKLVASYYWSNMTAWTKRWVSTNFIY